MPIEFACECGKAYKVADQYAGKRTKCTACGQPVLVPAPAAAEESAEDAALRALMDGAEDEPARSGGYAGRAEYSAPPPPPPRPAAPRFDADSYRPKKEKEKPKKKERSYSSSYDSPQESRWSPNWVKVGSGTLCLVGGLAWLGVGLLAGRFFFYPVFLILAGPFIIINGLLSKS